MNVHSFIGMVVDAKRPEEDVEDGGPGGAESPRYEAGMLRWSREFAITEADAGTPHGCQQKGLELDEDSDAMPKCCESSRKDQVENLLFNTIIEELKNSNKKRTCNCITITSAVFIYIYDD
jgi:hypothetical protein